MLCPSLPFPASVLRTLLRSSGFGLSVLLLGNSVMAATLPIRTRSDSESVKVAQLFKRQSPTGCSVQGCKLSIDQVLLRSGDTVVARYAGPERQIVRTGEPRSLTLNLSQPILNRAGQITIPANSLIEGELVPIEGGRQFVASHIIINGSAYSLAAESALLPDVKDPRRTSTGAIARDAALGAAGGIVAGRVLGQRRITAVQVLGGAAAGAAIGNVTAPRTVVIEPEQDITLKLTANFQR